MASEFFVKFVEFFLKRIEKFFLENASIELNLIKVFVAMAEFECGINCSARQRDVNCGKNFYVYFATRLQ